MPDAPYKCVVCRCPVHGPQDGVAFGAFGRFLFTTCHEHAPIARMAGKTAAQLATSSAMSLVERKAPLLARLMRDLNDARQKELAQ